MEDKVTPISAPEAPPGLLLVTDLNPSHGESSAAKISGATRKQSRARSQIATQDAIPEPFLRYDLENLFFKGPETGGGAYASICVLDPVITIERHHGKYHIAARFNIETTILRYGAHNDDHEWFFQDICLQYLSSSQYEDLVMKPESDSVAAFSVTRNTNTTTSGQAGLSGSGIPSANVSLGLSRSNQLTVEYSVKTWSVSAHHISSEHKELPLRPKGRTEYLKTKLGKKPTDDYQLPPEGEHVSQNFRKLYGRQEPRYQWFWAGNQQDTEVLTPDLKHTVKRHVVVKRVIPIELFPTQRIRYAKAMQAVAEQETIVERSLAGVMTAEDLVEANGISVNQAKVVEQEGKDYREMIQKKLERLREKAQDAEGEMRADKVHNNQTWKLEQILIFSFFIQVRIKRRYGRLHRLFLLSSNHVKGSILHPTYAEEIHLRVDLDNPIVAEIPLQDTEDVTAILNDVKEKYEGKWYELQDRNIVEIVPGLAIRPGKALGSRMNRGSDLNTKKTEKDLGEEGIEERRKDQKLRDSYFKAIRRDWHGTKLGWDDKTEMN